MMGGSLKNIVFMRWVREESRRRLPDARRARPLFAKYEPDLLKNPRAGTLVCDIGLMLPEMLIEIEAWAAVPR